MKKPAAWILFLFLFTGASFFAGHLWKERQEQSASTASSVPSFLPAMQCLEKRSFVIFVSGFNNGAFVEKTLRSIFSQQYPNYRLIYVDDASTDGSASLASDAIYASGQVPRTTFLRNEKRLGPLANLVWAARSCRDDEIFVILNGEDWLAHEWVLNRLNQYYANADLWLTYGQYREFPSYRLGSCAPLAPNASLRQTPAAHITHLKTFYAGLFKKIDEADLWMQGNFLPGSFDLAIMLPMLEMAQNHTQFIPETLYLANRHAQKEERELQLRSERHIRSLKPYLALEKL